MTNLSGTLLDNHHKYVNIHAGLVSAHAESGLQIIINLGIKPYKKLTRNKLSYMKDHIISFVIIV